MSRSSVLLSLLTSAFLCRVLFDREVRPAFNKSNFQIITSLCLFIISSLLSPDISAQRILTVEEAVATALQNNYDIQLSRNDSIVAALDYSYRNVVFLPTLNGSAGMSSVTNNQKLKFVKRSGGGGDSAVNRD